MKSHKLSYPFPRDTKGLVGVDSQVKELMSLLAIGSNDVRIIGVWGREELVKQLLLKQFIGKFLMNLKWLFYH